jgi:hypothetical protein
MKVLLGLLSCFLLFGVVAFADTFNAETGEMKAVLDSRTGSVTLTWSGIGKIVVVEQYLTQKVDGKWILRHKANNNSVTFNGFVGDRFNVLDEKGRYLLLTPEMIASKLRPVKFHGIILECSHKGGCALQIAPDTQ